MCLRSQKLSGALVESNKATSLRRQRKCVLSEDLLNWQTCMGYSVSLPYNLTYGVVGRTKLPHPYRRGFYIVFFPGRACYDRGAPLFFSPRFLTLEELNAYFTTGNPFFLTNSLEVSMGRNFGGSRGAEDFA